MNPTIRSRKKIRIGNQTSFSVNPVAIPFEYALSNAFDAFEWFPDKKESGEGWSEDDLSLEERLYIREISRDRDISLSVHAPWQANPLEPKALELLDKDIQLAGDLGAKLLNIHYYGEQGAAAYVKAIIPLLKRLDRADLKLSIENTPTTKPENFNELFSLLHDLKSVDISLAGMCLDVGHANLCSSTRHNYLLFLDLLDSGVPITHIHMHENYGDIDSHLPLFTGPSKEDDAGIRGLIRRLRKRDFAGCIILEQWPQPPAKLKEARNRLLDIINQYP